MNNSKISTTSSVQGCGSTDISQPSNGYHNDIPTPSTTPISSIRKSSSDSVVDVVPRPKSPFLRPSTPDPVHRTETTMTPNQTRIRIERELVLRSKSGVIDVPPSKSTLIGAYANLVNTIIGAGIIGIPYALKESGLVMGLLLIAIVAILTDKSLRLLIETGKVVDATSYETLMQSVFGKPGFVFISLNMLIMNYGAMICYMLIIKDTIPTLLGYGVEDVWVRRQILIFSSFLIILPLSMQRDMADLAKTSTLSVIFDLLMVMIITIFAPIRESIESTDEGLREILAGSIVHPRSLFIGLGVLSFAFVCQDSSFIIAGSLDRPTKERWAVVTRTSLLSCSSLAVIIGVAGYIGFREETDGNILNNFNALTTNQSTEPHAWMNTATAANTARLLLGSTMFFVYPLSSYIARHALIVLLFRGQRAHYGDDHTVLARRDRRIILTLVLYIAALVPALLFDDVGTILAVTGAVAGSSLSYLGPGAAYLGIHGGVFLQEVRERWGLDVKARKMLWSFPDDESDALDRSELTSLVGLGMPLDDAESVEGDDGQVSIFRFLIDVASWYIFCMPLWCFIARLGIVSMKEQALKSPMPNRLGKIIRYYNKNSISKENVNNKENRLLIRNSSGKIDSSDLKPLAPTVRPIPSYNATQDTNNAGSKKVSSKSTLRFLPPAPQNSAIQSETSSDSVSSYILKRISMSSIKSDDIKDQGEVESHDDSPQWFDFALAVMYILIGVLALCAGLVSIYIS